MPWTQPCCRLCCPSPAAVRARPDRRTKSLLRQIVRANFDPRNLAQTAQAVQQVASPVARPTNSSVPRAPTPRDSAPLSVELQTAAQREPTTAPAAQPAQVQPNLASHGPQVARHGKRMIGLRVRQRVLPQAQPARAVRPRTAPSLPNPHGRSRNAPIGQKEVPVQNEVLAQTAKHGQRSSAPLRLAAKLLPVERGFSTRTLAPCGRPIFT